MPIQSRNNNKLKASALALLLIGGGGFLLGFFISFFVAKASDNQALNQVQTQNYNQVQSLQAQLKNVKNQNSTLQSAKKTANSNLMEANAKLLFQQYYNTYGNANLDTLNAAKAQISSVATNDVANQLFNTSDGPSLKSATGGDVVGQFIAMQIYPSNDLGDTLTALCVVTYNTGQSGTSNVAKAWQISLDVKDAKINSIKDLGTITAP